MPLDSGDLQTLIQMGHKELYILNSERDKYQAFIEENMLAKMFDESIDLDQRTTMLFDQSIAVVGELMERPESRRQVKRSKKLIAGMTRLIDHTPKSISSFILTDRLEDYILTHCVNVCFLGIGLGGRLGVISNQDLQTLGLGCLLHDVGTQAIPEAIVQKSNQLSEREMMIFKRHPEVGHKQCRKNKEIPELALIPILQHHESIDGTGYPKGLKGDEIHLFARIAAVIDAFDALTTDRPNAPAMDIFPALEFMKKNLGSKLDQKIFTELVMMLRG